MTVFDFLIRVLVALTIILVVITFMNMWIWYFNQESVDLSKKKEMKNVLE